MYYFVPRVRFSRFWYSISIFYYNFYIEIIFLYYSSFDFEWDNSPQFFISISWLNILVKAFFWFEIRCWYSSALKSGYNSRYSWWRSAYAIHYVKLSDCAFYKIYLADFILFDLNCIHLWLRNIYVVIVWFVLNLLNVLECMNWIASTVLY